jgi:hypothetical protein
MTSMRLADKAVVHQVHPAKIGADITASVISNALLWNARPKAAITVRGTAASGRLTGRTQPG